MLAIEGVTYKDFVQALQYTNLGVYNGVTKPGAISEALLAGFKRAAAVAEEHGMSRAFTVALQLLVHTATRTVKVTLQLLKSLLLLVELLIAIAQLWVFKVMNLIPSVRLQKK